MVDVSWLVLPTGAEDRPLSKQHLYNALITLARAALQPSFEDALSFRLHLGGTAASAVFTGKIRRPREELKVGGEGAALGTWQSDTAGAHSCDPDMCLLGWVAVYKRSAAFSRSRL